MAGGKVLVRIVARTTLLPIVVIAIIAAVLMAFLSLLNAIFKNPVIAIPQSVIAALAALGLTDGDVWAGYGFALFLGCATAAKVYASLPIESLENPYFLATAIVPLAIAALGISRGQKPLMTADLPEIRGQALSRGWSWLRFPCR